MPVGCLEVIVEPAEENLLRGESQELFKSLVFFEQPVEFRVKLDINLAQQSATDNLPNQTQNQMLPDLDDIASTNVHNRAPNTLGGLNNDVVVLAHLEGIEVLGLLSWPVQNSLVNGVRDTVVDELGKHKTILALVEHLKCIGREGQAVADVGITSQNSVDMAGELGSLILVDGVGDIGIGALDLNLAAYATLGSMATSSLSDNASSG